MQEQLIIDLVHNDVKQYFRDSNVYCGSSSHERIQYALVFPKRETNGSNADTCSDVAGPSSSGSGHLFDFGSSSRSHTLTIFPTTSTIGRHLEFESDLSSHIVDTLILGPFQLE